MYNVLLVINTNYMWDYF